MMLRPILLLFCAASIGTVAAAQRPAEPTPAVSLRIPLGGGSAPRELQLYPMHEITERILGDRADVLAVGTAEWRAAARTLIADLRDGIRALIEPPLAEGEDVQALGNDHLAVVGRAEQHAWTQRFLDLQVRHADTIAVLEVEVLKVAPETFEALDLGTEPRVLTGDAAKAFRKNLFAPGGEPRAGLERLSAPRLPVLATQRARIAAIEQVSYLKDYEIRTLDDGSMIADPEVGTVEPGLTLDGSFLMVDDSTLAIAWHVRLTDLQRPIPKFQTGLGGKQPVEIQIPNLATAEFDARVVLAPGSLSVFPGPEMRGNRIVLAMSVAELRRDGR